MHFDDRLPSVPNNTVRELAAQIASLCGHATRPLASRSRSQLHVVAMPHGATDNPLRFLRRGATTPSTSTLKVCSLIRAFRCGLLLPLNRSIRPGITQGCPDVHHAEQLHRVLEIADDELGPLPEIFTRRRHDENTLQHRRFRRAELEWSHGRRLSVRLSHSCRIADHESSTNRSSSH